MEGTVASLSMVFMAVSAILSFGLPIVLLIYFRKVKRADILPFFVGCAVMLVFALILESAVHRAVFASSAGESIQNNIWLYALYGGLMAGIFEETGRFVAFKTLLRRHRDNDANALMYGAGHGGFEAAVLLGITMVNNIVWSVMINGGNADMLTGNLSGDALEQVRLTMGQLVSMPSWQFLMGAVERVFAIVIHISLSILVWFAAKKGGRLLLYPAARLRHFAVDAATVIVSGSGASAVLMEFAVGVMALLCALCARRVWKKHRTDPEKTDLA
ncbi:MAG: YhfC family intramembrane metalloprotease [Oscillospiraceae bacterium]|nr:YhfC family intramembrane metalloprotease [Oscillospiraceae bacterium]